MNLENTINSVGRAKVMAALNLSKQSISNAVSDGIAPASWYDAIDKLGRSKGIVVPRCLFNFKQSVEDS